MWRKRRRRSRRTTYGTVDIRVSNPELAPAQDNVSPRERFVRTHPIGQCVGSWQMILHVYLDYHSLSACSERRKQPATHVRPLLALYSWDRSRQVHFIHSGQPQLLCWCWARRRLQVVSNGQLVCTNSRVFLSSVLVGFF